LKETKQKLVSWLFETKAVRVCPQDKPFWYTSGTIGPYYINTHFLYGSEEKANKLLELIDLEKGDRLGCPGKIFEAVCANYEKDGLFKGLIDEMVLFIRDNIKLDEIDCISGGERRDWFFSLIISKLLDKPHLTIYKDLNAVLSCGGKAEPAESLQGKRLLHIADLITEASSYTRAWIPAVNRLGGEMKWSLVVVDRLQGGAQSLAADGVKSFSMINVDSGLFDEALALGLINDHQYSLIMEYLDDPKGSMRNFLIMHPEFMENSLNADEKTRQRAKLCLEKDYYGLG
jgi:orotate phosphoribosyltransferase